MMDQEDHRGPGPTGHEERDLVKILHHHVKAVRVQGMLQVGGHPKSESHSAADPVDLHSIQSLQWEAFGEAGGQESYGVPSSCQPAEHLVKVRLGSPRLRVQPIQPVDNEDLQKWAPGLVTPEGRDA